MEDSSHQARRATHAGSWYSRNPSTLSTQLQAWKANADVSSTLPQGCRIRAIIGPHAGLSYCGVTAAHAYKNIDPTGVKRVFLLGPSHHLNLKGCSVSGADVYETPLGTLQVDKEVVRDLLSHGKSFRTPFQTLELDDDEEEHSLELHLPWIAHTFSTNVRVVPILVGSLGPISKSGSSLPDYGTLFSRYLDDSANFFVISSDFCHWGARFGYTYIVQRSVDIHKSIEKLDRMGMEAIETLDPEIYTQYQNKYENTICGRHPITLFLYANKTIQTPLQMKFVHYSQSSRCMTSNDSSVSYAAGVFFQA